MNSGRFTVFLYSKKDAINFLKNKDKLCFSKIYPLTPDSYSEIYKKIDSDRIILPDEYFLDFSHKRVITKVKKIEKNLFLKINSLLVDDYKKETLKHICHFSFSSAYYLWFSMKPFGPWLIFDGLKWRYIDCLDDAFRIFYIQVNNEMQPFFFGQIPKYNQRFKKLIQLLNKLSIKFFVKKKSIFVTGLDYRLEEITQKILSNNKKLSIFTFLPFQRTALIKLFYLFCVNLLKNLFKHNLGTVYLVPVINTVKYDPINIKFLFSDIDDGCINLIADKLQEKYLKVINYLESIEKSIDFIIDRIEPSALIAHQLKIGNAVLLGSIFKKKRIPVYLASHGSHPEPQETFAETELNDNLQGLLISDFATNLVIQSKSAKNVLKNKKIRSEQIDSLPIMWGRSYTKKNRKESKFTILHAGTPKPLGTRPYIYETSFEYYNSIKKIINFISKFDDIKLIIRFRPAAEFSEKSFLKLIKPKKNIHIRFGGNFYDDLENSDLLISFASTTIEETLYEHKPVGLYGSNKKFRHLKGSISVPTSSKRHAVYHLTDENFTQMITEIKKLHYNTPLIYKELQNYIWDNSYPDISKFVKRIIDNKKSD